MGKQQPHWVLPEGLLPPPLLSGPHGQQMYGLLNQGDYAGCCDGGNFIQ